LPVQFLKAARRTRFRNMSTLLTISEASQIYEISERVLRKRISRGTFPAYKQVNEPKAVLLVDRADLEREYPRRPNPYIRGRSYVDDVLEHLAKKVQAQREATEKALKETKKGVGLFGLSATSG
jgi:hypothetical protein